MFHIYTHNNLIYNNINGIYGSDKMEIEIKLFDSKQLEETKVVASVEIEQTCPICHKAGKPEYANGCIVRSFNKDEKPLLFTVWYCTNCKKYYVSLYHMINGLKNVEKDSQYPYPKEVEENSIPQDIKDKYPDFTRIFSEACECERLGLLSIAGTGYRKALEFLVKDYLQQEQGLTKESIGECRLEKCCQKIEFEPIRKLSNAVTWLGNDETHYVVKHPEYDINEMKGFLDALISSIHNKYKLEKAEELLNKK